MLEEQAVVVKVTQGSVWVETCRQSACQSCSSRSTCGHSLLSKMSSDKTRRLQVSTDQSFQVGDQVVLGLDEQAFLAGSALVYLLPLLTLIAGALAGEYLFGQDSAGGFLTAGLGLALGFAYVRFYSRRHRKDACYQPVVLQKVPAGGDIPLFDHS